MNEGLYKLYSQFTKEELETKLEDPKITNDAKETIRIVLRDKFGCDYVDSNIEETNLQDTINSEITGFKEPSKSFIIAGWIVFAVSIFSIPFGLSLIPIIASWIMVGIDASKLRLNELKYSKLDLSSVERAGISGWVAGCVLLWIIFYPIYLLKRQKLAHAVFDTVSGQIYMNSEEKAEYKRQQRKRTLIGLGIVISLLIIVIALIILFK